MSGKLIYRDNYRVERITNDNLRFCEAINSAIDSLNELGIALHGDDDIETFVSTPATLVKSVTSDQAGKFNEFYSGLPTWADRPKFDGDKLASAIYEIHKKMGTAKPGIFDPIWGIKDGRAVIDEAKKAAMVDAFSVYADSPDREKAAELIKTISKGMDALNKLVTSNSASRLMGISTLGNAIARVGFDGKLSVDWQKFNLLR